MQAKEVRQEKTAKAKDFTEELCALVREHLVGITERNEDGFVFFLPGGIKKFSVCIKEL